MKKKEKRRKKERKGKRKTKIRKRKVGWKGSGERSRKSQEMLKFRPGHPGTGKDGAGRRQDGEGMGREPEVGQRTPSQRMLTASQPGAAAGLGDLPVLLSGAPGPGGLCTSEQGSRWIPAAVYLTEGSWLPADQQDQVTSPFPSS